MKYHFQIHKEGSGYWAECLEIKGCITQANSKEELLQNAAEALNLHLSEPPESDVEFPRPRPSLRHKPGVIVVSVEPSVAFAICLKRLRKRSHLTQQEAASKLGMKNLWSYQKLESPKGSNPELKTLSRIRTAFPGFSIDELFDDD